MRNIESKICYSLFGNLLSIKKFIDMKLEIRLDKIKVI